MARLACRRLRQELGIRDEATGAEAARLRLLEENKKTREEQDAVRRRNPILVYVEKLAAADESAWQDNLETMGNTPDIPKLFRHAGKVCLPFKRLYNKCYFAFAWRFSGTQDACRHRIHPARIAASCFTLAQSEFAMQIRNKQVTKHFTEKTIKEIWKGRMAEHKSGKAIDLCDFVCNHFQKKVGIMSAVVEVRVKEIWQHGWSCEVKGIRGLRS